MSHDIIFKLFKLILEGRSMKETAHSGLGIPKNRILYTIEFSVLVANHLFAEAEIVTDGWA